MSNISESAVNPKVFIGKIRELLDSFTGSESGLSDHVQKAITDRYTSVYYFSVSEDGKNVTILDSELPTDATAQEHSLVNRYAILSYRSRTTNSTKDGVTILDEGTTTDEAQNYALGLVENNRNNIYSVQVLIGVPWMYAGRPVFRRVVSFYLVSASADMDGKSGVPHAVIEARKVDSSSSPTPDKKKKVKKGYTADTWEDPSDSLSVKKLAELVPTAIKEWSIRLARATDGQVSKEMLIFPHKTVDGIINLNAVDNALKKVDKANVPVSVRKAVKEELEKHVQKSEDVVIEVPFIKSADALDRGLLYGIVYEPLVKDTEKDFATAEEIEGAAHKFLPKAMLNVEHKSDQQLEDADSVVVESYLAPCDFKIDQEIVRKGSWVLVTKLFSEELIEKVRNGEITGYSMEGTSFRLG